MRRSHPTTGATFGRKPKPIRSVPVGGRCWRLFKILLAQKSSQQKCKEKRRDDDDKDLVSCDYWFGVGQFSMLVSGSLFGAR